MGFIILLLITSISNSPVSASERMEYVKLCDRGVCRKFSRLIMGTDHLVQANWSADGKPEMNEDQVFKVLDEALKRGINFFDTSPIYVGGVENLLGRWKKSREKIALRDDFYYDPSANPDRKIYILSKGGFPSDLFYSKKMQIGTHSSELINELHNRGILRADIFSPFYEEQELINVPPGTYSSRLYGDRDQITQRVRGELNHTINNLNGDITVYLMHRDDGDYISFNEIVREKTPVDVIMQALSSSGVADHIGLLGWSNWQTDRVNQSIQISQDNSSLLRPMFNSPYFSLFEMSARSIHAGGIQVTHREMSDPDFQNGINIMSYSPLGGFSILDRPEPRWENAKKAAKEKFDLGDPYWKNVFYAIFTEENKMRYDRVQKMTELYNQKFGSNYTIDQMINAYALAHIRANFLAVGPITIEQLDRTVNSLKLSKTLIDSDLEYLHSGNAQLRF